MSELNPEAALGEIKGALERKMEDSMSQRMAELEEKVNAQVRAIAADLKPKAEVIQPTAWRDVANAMAEKRAITVNGTGAVQVLNDIVSVLAKKTGFINRYSYFYGRDASTVIPVFSALPAAPSPQSEGATSISADSTATLAATSIAPKAQVSLLKISAEALTLSGADLEGRMAAIFANAYARAIANGSLNGDGSGNNMFGMFIDSALSNDSTCAATGAPKLADILGLALTVQDYADDAAILINPTFVAGLLTESTTDLAWLKEEIGRNKTALGIPVIASGWAPSTTTGGNIVAVAMPLSNYAIAMAQEFRVTPIRQVGDTNTYFQAEAFFNGKPILAGNGWQLKAKSA